MMATMAPSRALPPSAKAANTTAPRPSANDGAHQRLRQNGRRARGLGGTAPAGEGPALTTTPACAPQSCPSTWKTSSTVVPKKRARAIANGSDGV